MRIYDSPCINLAVLGHLQPQWHDKVQRASAIVGGRLFEACWLVDGENAHLMYEDGDQGLILLADFKPDNGI